MSHFSNRPNLIIALAILGFCLLASGMMIRAGLPSDQAQGIMSSVAAAADGFIRDTVPIVATDPRTLGGVFNHPGPDSFAELEGPLGTTLVQESEHPQDMNESNQTSEDGGENDPTRQLSDITSHMGSATTETYDDDIGLNGQPIPLGHEVLPEFQVTFDNEDPVPLPWPGAFEEQAQSELALFPQQEMFPQQRTFQQHMSFPQHGTLQPIMDLQPHVSFPQYQRFQAPVQPHQSVTAPRTYVPSQSRNAGYLRNSVENWVSDPATYTVGDRTGVYRGPHDGDTAGQGTGSIPLVRTTSLRELELSATDDYTNEAPYSSFETSGTHGPDTEAQSFAVSCSSTAFNPTESTDVLQTSSVASAFCKYCSAEFDTEASMILHRDARHPDKRYVCPYDATCPKTFKYPKDVRKHKSVHSKAKDYICLRCSTLFTREDNLLRHRRKEAH